MSLDLKFGCRPAPRDVKLVCSGVVVIGRNEGERLRACLESLRGHRVVYVDSRSTDGSVALARMYGCEVVELDMARPFSAARARNEGLARLREVATDVEYAQFVDGDCVLVEGWLEAAVQFLGAHPEYAAVCGRRRERYPEKSLYNRLCDIEWNTPVGDALACGGDAMFRVSAFEQVGGFNPDVTAGEEPELCVRFRQAGWKIRRLDHDMTFHDAAMTRFGQWWRRTVRTGYGFSLAISRSPQLSKLGWTRQVRSAWIWGVVLPLLALGLAWPTCGVSLVLLAGYPVLTWKVFRHMRGRGFAVRDAWLYAVFCVLAKFPQVQGQLRFHWGRLRARPSGIIEYKADERNAQVSETT